MNEEKWNKVREFYSENFGIKPELVDLLASNDILLMCVSGSSNDSISRALDIDIEAIKEVISIVMDFDGWAMDLDLNPYSIFSDLALSGRVLFSDFSTEVEFVSPEIKSDDIKSMFRTCRIYDKIATKLDNEWI